MLTTEAAIMPLQPIYYSWVLNQGKGKRHFISERSRLVLEPNLHTIQRYLAYLQRPELEVDC
jgi:hypothetical protein